MEKFPYERISDEVFEALVVAVARRIVESDELFETLFMRRIEQVIGHAVLTKGAVLFGAICIAFAIMNWDKVKVWLT